MPQILQNPVTRILLRSLLASVANSSDAAFQAKFLTFGGTLACHIFNQHGSLPAGYPLEAPKARCSLNASLYAVLTEKLPDFSGCQAMTSDSARRDVLIFRYRLWRHTIIGRSLTDWVQSKK
jgi:hypothetical protein